MWPLLLASVLSIGVTFERLLFIFNERNRRNSDAVERIISAAERGDADAAIRAGEGAQDFVARTLVYGLKHRDKSFSSAILRAANIELKRFGRGLPALDTIITLAPLLGLLGTVTGMISAFGLLGGRELDAPAAITGGIAEALIATAFGLAIAIISLIPYNYLVARLEEARHELEDACNNLELLILKPSRRSSDHETVVAGR
jgi:biopolymer transport protein ExbB